ncbi:MAG: GNAT family protein [Anaerolineae bacterium]
MFVGKQVRLAPVRRDDLEQYAAWFSDPEVTTFVAPDVLRLFSYDDEVAWYEDMRKDKDLFTFAIRTLDDDRLLGNCSLRINAWRNRSAVFGIAIGNKPYWGRGYGTEATRLLLEYGFGELNLNRVELEVFAFNTRAIRSYEKVGFVHEGTRRQALYRNGAYHDIYIMGLLRQEWFAKQPPSGHNPGGQ